MRICVTGTSCVGKSTFIADFIKQWPMYKVADNSYRDEAKKRGIKLNKEGNVEDQRIIRDILLQQIESNKNEKYVLYDRGPLDNLVYSIWLNAKNQGNVDDLFIEQCLAKSKAAMENYDIIFFIPISEQYPVAIVPDNQRDIDPIFRKEIDFLFKGIIQTYVQKKDTFFPLKDCPAVIEIFGSPEARISIASMYVNPKGDVFSEDESLLNDVADPEVVDAAKKAFNLR